MARRGIARPARAAQPPLVRDGRPRLGVVPRGVAARLTVSSTQFADDGDWQRVGTQLGVTPRELVVLRSLFDGDSEKEIAARLSISPATVHTHLERLHRKFCVQNRAQLLRTTFDALRAGSSRT
jgi:DNA-binding NarL/FixJ family response regulator